MPSIRVTPKRKPTLGSSRRKSSATATPIGNIMAAVAVFEIHIESDAVASMNPSTSRSGLDPTAARIEIAIRR